MPLKHFLDKLQHELHRTDLLSSDPLEFVHRYSDPWDQEAVALVSALLAYGNVKQIRASIHGLLDRMGMAPSAFVKNLARNPRDGDRALAGWKHRFNTGKDMTVLLALLAKSWRRHGFLGGHFLEFLSPTDTDFGSALSQLIGDWRRWAREDGRSGGPQFFHLLTSPADGSCCKRWCMLLRWMGRKDALDPGLWTERGAFAAHKSPRTWLRADQLVLPLDTHTSRISRYLGLSSRKSVDWKTALEVTERLRTCDSTDPTRYDFALSRLGILDLCRNRYVPEVCGRCTLNGACHYSLKTRMTK